jgi:hypothetical protein
MVFDEQLMDALVDLAELVQETRRASEVLAGSEVANTFELQLAREGQEAIRLALDLAREARLGTEPHVTRVALRAIVDHLSEQLTTIRTRVEG